MIAAMMSPRTHFIEIHFLLSLTVSESSRITRKLNGAISGGWQKSPAACLPGNLTSRTRSRTRLRRSARSWVRICRGASPAALHKRHDRAPCAGICGQRSIPGLLCICLAQHHRINKRLRFFAKSLIINSLRWIARVQSPYFTHSHARQRGLTPAPG